MIRITFDLLPLGNQDRARTIGVMEIANIKTYLDGTADYAVVLKKTPPFSGALHLAWRRGTVKCDDVAVNGVISGNDEALIAALVSSHHRTKRGVYDLFYRALKACGLDRRDPTNHG